jgi:hypothetical protein
VNRFAAALCASLALAGLAACSDGTDAQPVGAARPSVVPSTVAPTTGVHKDLGDKALVLNPDGSPLFDITLDRFVDTSCDQATTAVNGRFTAVQLTVHTFDDPQNRLPGVKVDQGWRYLSADGKTILPANTPAARTCHHEDVALSARHSYSTAVVLDVPPDADDDRVSLDVADTHWEWQLGN